MPALATVCPAPLDPGMGQKNPGIPASGWLGCSCSTGLQVAPIC